MLQDKVASLIMDELYQFFALLSWLGLQAKKSQRFISIR